MAVRKKIGDLSVNELKAMLKKMGLSEFGERSELLARLKQAVTENRKAAKQSCKTTEESGTQDEKTTSTNEARNTSGMEEKAEELDLEVMMDDFEGGGGGGGIGNDGKEGVSSTQGTSGENEGERKESESRKNPIGKETPKPVTTLWISGLSSTAKATDLKQLFSHYGQVNGAKVVASSKSESKRFGIVTMSTAEEAQACIENVNNTQFQDNLITVELDPKQCNAAEASQPVTETDSKQDDLASSASLWIKGLATTTKAIELKEIFGKYGEVIQGKVVASAKNPDSKCYCGILTMSSSEEADRCIENLNQTEVNGQIITVEKRKQDPALKTKSSFKPERVSSPFERNTFERGRFSGHRGFRGRSFPPRPFMGRGRNPGFRGKGREAFMYMDQLRADYERQMFHEQRMREEGDEGYFNPEFRGGRGRFPRRSRPPFERSWNDARGGFRRGMPSHEPYWGQAAKRPRMDDERTGPAGQFGESGNRLPAEIGGGGEKWNSSYHGDGLDPTYPEPYGGTSQDVKDFGNKSKWQAPDTNMNKKGNSGSTYTQWQSGGTDSANNSSGTYQAGHVMYSSYNAVQSYPSSGLDSSGGSYMGAGNSTYATTTGTNTHGATGSNLYGDAGSSYSAKESGSYIGTITSVYSAAGGGSYGGEGTSSYPAAGSSSYMASGSSSYPTTGSSSYPAAGSGSYGGAAGSSGGGTASGSYSAAATDSYYGSTYTSLYSAAGSSSYDMVYAAPVSTTYSATSVSYQGTGSYAQQGASSYGGTSMYATGAAYPGNAGNSTGTGNSQSQYDAYKQQGSSQAYSWY